MMKASLRKHYVEIRNQIPLEERLSLSEAIVSRLEHWPIYQSCRSIGLFFPIRSEVDLLPLVADGRKTFWFPRIIDQAKKQMEFAGGDLRSSGLFGLMEPVGERISSEQLDMILVPGIAFSQQGYRIGYGKGYYDVYLQSYHGVTVGVGFHQQWCFEMPVDPHDQRLDYLVSDQEVLCTQSSL